MSDAETIARIWQRLDALTVKMAELVPLPPPPATPSLVDELAGLRARIKQLETDVVAAEHRAVERAEKAATTALQQLRASLFDKGLPIILDPLVDAMAEQKQHQQATRDAVDGMRGDTRRAADAAAGAIDTADKFLRAVAHQFGS